MKTFGRIAYAIFNFLAAGGAATGGIKIFQAMNQAEFLLAILAVFVGFYIALIWLGEGVQELLKIGKL